MGKREDQALQTKNKIIEAAKKLIIENGFDNVSVDDITKLAGVAKGSYYVYFKKKEDIISEIGCLEFRYINEEIINMKDISFIDKLKYYAKRYKQGLLDLGVEISKCWLQDNLNCRCKLEYDYSTISNMINEGIKNKEIKEDINVSDLTYFIISVLYGIMLVWIMSNGQIEASNQVDNIKFEDMLKPYLCEV